MRKTKTLQQRLKACMSEGNLTFSDMARWFDRPIPTLRYWIDKGGTPKGGPIDREHAVQMLGLLETLIKQGKGFPVPRMSPTKRMAHLQNIRRTILNAAL